MVSQDIPTFVPRHLHVGGDQLDDAATNRWKLFTWIFILKYKIVTYFVLFS